MATDIPSGNTATRLHQAKAIAVLATSAVAFAVTAARILDMQTAQLALILVLVSWFIGTVWTLSRWIS